MTRSYTGPNNLVPQGAILSQLFDLGALTVNSNTTLTVGGVISGPTFGLAKSGDVDLHYGSGRRGTNVKT